MRYTDTDKKVVVFGEVLFDVFPNGNSVIGGAPFNVACHLKGFGLNPMLISRIGNDRLGKKVIHEMNRRELDQSGMQIDAKYPTGRVEVEIKDNEPSYTIKKNTAWDYIEKDASIRDRLAKGGMFYHGSLAARHPVSRETLEDYLQMKTENFCDLNLRPPWWTKDCINSLLEKITHLKLNLEELKVVSGENVQVKDLSEKIKMILKRFNLRSLVVTMGNKGALAVKENGEEEKRRAPEVKDFTDSVGAGDAFAAVMILNILKKSEMKDALRNAVDFAAEICRVRGAVPKNEGLYRKTTNSWEKRDGSG
ncbi:MAG: carbohydrate kinase family protein [Thermodesulfobacteriota bacterium]